MAPGTSVGAAAPVYQTSEGMQPAGEKTVSAVRTQMAALAEKNGYPPEVALAMVDQDLELQAIQEEEQGYRFIANNSKDDSKDNPQDDGDEEEAAIILSSSGKLLTLTAGEMERYGISSGTVESLDALQERLELSTIMRFKPSSADQVVHLLTSAAVTSLLLTIGLLALYLEISSPGFGIPGTAALVAFALMFISSGLMGTLSSIELLLFLAGVILLLVEVFLIPGFGVAGISGLIFMTVGLVLSRQEFILPDTEWQMEIFTRNLLLVFGTLAVSFVLLGILMMFFPRIRLFQRLILNTPGSTPVSETPNPEKGIGTSYAPTPQNPQNADLQVGDTGTVLTTLRPAGKIEVGDETYSVVTDGRWIEAGAKVSVVAIRGNRIVVEEVGQ
ncbi:MAG: nodulation protein NfeD [Spirochaetia bacterium]|nr:nodulation protein NfeD [Spirochaetia bacterium]